MASVLTNAHTQFDKLFMAMSSFLVVKGRARLYSPALKRPHVVKIYVVYPRCSHHHAAAGVNVLAGQPTRLFAHHEGHDVGDVLGRAESLERRGLFAGLAEGGIGGHHGSVCEPGRDRIHGDPLGRKFVCETFRELFESPFAAEVNSGTGKADM